MKHKLSTRISCALLTLVMIFLFIPLEVYAAVGEGLSGLIGDLMPAPSTITYIYTAEQLSNIGRNEKGVYKEKLLAGTYILMNDIDLATLTNEDGTQKNWTPIGDGENKFTGHFLGAGYTIKNLKIDVNKLTPGDENSTIYAGLFGYNTGTIRDVVVKGQVSSYDENGAPTATNGNQKYCVGKLVGYNEGTVDNCYDGITYTDFEINENSLISSATYELDYLLENDPAALKNIVVGDTYAITWE